MCIKTTKSVLYLNQILIALNYSDIRNASKRLIDRKYTIRKRFINVDETERHPNTLYLSESGLYRLMARSQMPNAIIFSDWIFDDLLPTIRKFGKYKLEKDYENEMFKLAEKINFLEKQNQILKRDLKKDYFPKGGLVYVIDYSENNEYIYRIGRTQNMNTRKKVYDTHTLHNKRVVFYQEIECLIQFEACLRSMLYQYRYKHNKDFYFCSLYTIKKSFKICEKNIQCMNRNIKKNYR